MVAGSESPPYLIESVDNALKILLMLRTRPVIRVTDVSVELGVARSTAHRLLATLQHEGFVNQDRHSRAYRSGRVLLELGLEAIGGLDVRRKARRYLEQLSLEHRETVNLMMLEGHLCRFVDGVEGDRPLRVGLRTGAVLPAHTTSGGKVLLAELDDQALAEVLAEGLPTLTPYSISKGDELDAELARVRKRGYALNRNESELDLSAVAVPIRNSEGRAVAALALSTPASRMSDRDVLLYADSLKRAAAMIRNDL